VLIQINKIDIRKINEIVDKLAKSGVYNNKSVFKETHHTLYGTDYLDNIDMNDFNINGK